MPDRLRRLDMVPRVIHDRKLRSFLLWCLPHGAIVMAAAGILRSRSLGADCSASCLATQGWFLFTVLYGTLSVAAIVAAFELFFWLLSRASWNREVESRTRKVSMDSHSPVLHQIGP